MEEVGGFTTAHTLSDQGIVDGLARIHAAETSLAASRMSMLAEADRRGLALKLGQSSVKRWYGNAVRIPQGNAANQIALGYWLGAHPSVAEALDNSTIHEAHAKAIADGFSTILAADPTLTDDHRADAVAALLDLATHSLPRAVTDRAHELAHHAARDARARYDAEQQRRRHAERDVADNSDKGEDTDKGTERSPDDNPTDDNSPDSAPPDNAPAGPPPLPVAERTDLNSLTIYPLANGRRRFVGDFDKLTAEIFTTALSPLSAPKPSEDGARDPRSTGQRNADGFSELLDRYLQGRHTSGQGGSNVTVTVRLSDLMKTGDDPDTGKDDTANRAPGRHGNNVPTPTDPDWPFHLDWTGSISRYLAQFLACDGKLTPVIVDGNGVPLALGRTFRLATPSLRRAVTIRDRCCVMCGRPADWCQVHHIRYWTDGGPTDLNNLALVCSECHQQIHNTDWELVMGDDGHPHAIPPAIVDRERKPIPSYHRRKRRSA